MSDLTQLSISEALAQMRARELSAVELTEAYLTRIEQLDPKIKSYITITGEYALNAAKNADQRRQKGEDAPLLGIPMGIKDVYSTRGNETSCGSKILQGYTPVFSATVVERLEAAGMVMLGKLNMDEFAMGSSTENSGYFVTRNPWDLERVPGGSSGGSAAALVAGMAAGALGTDTGGSIRQPGAFCGIPALKPSYGRVSRYGVIAFGSSLDCPGPMARRVEDVARLMQVIAGHDPLDATSMPLEPPDYVAALKDGIEGLKIGIPKEYFIEGIEPDVEKAVRSAISQLEILGAQIVEISLPHTEYSLPTYYIIAPAEASANLARYDGVRFGLRVEKGEMWPTYKATRGQGFGAEVKRRIMIGTYALSAGYYDAYYGKAQAVRTLIKQDFEQAFEKVHLIAAPVAPTTAFKIGANTGDPLKMYLEDVFTLPASLAGVPAMNVPCGFDHQGLPIGLQIIAPAFQEDRLLRAAYSYEQSTSWHERQPELL